MKKVWRWAILAVIIVALLVSTAATGLANGIQVVVNGRAVNFTDVGPRVEGGRTLVPVRAVAEVLGAQVQWQADTETVTFTKPGLTVQLVVGQPTALVNGQSVILDVPARIVNGRTMVPLRFLAEALGEPVSWDAMTRTAHVGKRPAASPAPSLFPGLVPEANPAAAQVDQMIMGLKAMATLTSRPGKLDPAALDLLTKSPVSKNVDFSARFDVAVQQGVGANADTLDVQLTLGGAVRGEEGLFHFMLAGFPGMAPMDGAFALRNSSVWAKLGNQPWERQDDIALRPLPALQGASPVPPEKVAELLKAAVGAGLIDITMGTSRQENGMDLSAVMIAAHGDEVVRLLRTFGQAQGLAELDQVQIDVRTLTLSYFFDAQGKMRGVDMELDLSVADLPGPEQVSLQARMHLTMSPDATAPVQWPAEIAGT